MEPYVSFCQPVQWWQGCEAGASAERKQRFCEGQAGGDGWIVNVVGLS